MSQELLSVVADSKLNGPKRESETKASGGKVPIPGMRNVRRHTDAKAYYPRLWTLLAAKYNHSMPRFKEIVSAWGFALIMMIAIFIFSAQAAVDLPNFGSFDTVVKKGGHVLGYALLAVSYWRGLKWERERAWQAWLLAVLYAITDEFHQQFVAGRHPSTLDVFLFDGAGAAIGLWVRQRLLRP